MTRTFIRLLWIVIPLFMAIGVPALGGELASTDTIRVSSTAIDAGDYIYISGQGPRRPNGTLPPNFSEQCRQAFDNIRNVVEAAGLTNAHVVYTQVYLEDISKYQEMNEVFGKY